MSWPDLVTAALVLTGCFFFATGTIGLFRFPDLRTRLHALTKADNLGLGFVVAGLAVQAGSAGEVAKLVLVWALALLAAATNGHLLGRDEPEEEG